MREAGDKYKILSVSPGAQTEASSIGSLGCKVNCWKTAAMAWGWGQGSSGAPGGRGAAGHVSCWVPVPGGLVTGSGEERLKLSIESFKNLWKCRCDCLPLWLWTLRWLGCDGSQLRSPFRIYSLPGLGRFTSRAFKPRSRGLQQFMGHVRVHSKFQGLYVYHPKYERA